MKSPLLPLSLDERNNIHERRPFLSTVQRGPRRAISRIVERHPLWRTVAKHWIPVSWEVQEVQVHDRQQKYTKHVIRRRSVRRRVFLLLTEPATSIASALFFTTLVVLIFVANVVLIMQTMRKWQYTPIDCRFCGGKVLYLWEENTVEEPHFETDCVCPPTPFPWTVHTLNWLVYFFTVEWILRVVTFEPTQNNHQAYADTLAQWWSFLTSYGTVLDALAIFPYYFEMSIQTKGLMSLRLLRLFRVFQLVRLGQYNETFMSLSTVLYQSVPYLKLLLGVLMFGAAFFGSILYWLEKGEWKYFKTTGTYEFIRLDEYGQEEISPFRSIPASFWWFFVTAMTVGYGDTYPTTTAGKWVATAAMLMGVLVIAFPVSVFSYLWSKQLRKRGALTAFDDDDAGDNEALDRSVREKKSRTFSNSTDEAAKRRPKETTNIKSREVSSNKTGGELSRQEDGSKNMLMDKDDIAAIFDLLKSMDDSQRQIKAILERYDTE